MEAGEQQRYPGGGSAAVITVLVGVSAARASAIQAIGPARGVCVYVGQIGCKATKRKLVVLNTFCSSDSYCGCDAGDSPATEILRVQYRECA